MLHLSKVHHIAIICSDYQRSRHFYTAILGLKVLNEVYRAEKKSYKLDLSLDENYIIELFSFDDPPQRPSYPEAAGLRHIAFETEDLDSGITFLKENGILSEPVRIDEYTGKRFTFIQDPDKLPIELYEKIS